MEKEVKNEHGEKIKVKIENGRVFVHHNDCTDSFIPLDELFMKHILDINEVITIHNIIKELYVADIDTSKN